MKKMLFLILFINLLFAKTFTVSYDPDYAPFTYVKNHKAEGLLVDIWKFWANKNGYKLKFVNGKDWDNALLLAKEGKVDFFIGTDAHDKWMKASRPFYQVKTGFFIKDGSKKKFHTVGLISDDYKNDIKKLVKNIQIKQYPTYEALFQALKTNKIDAIYDDYLPLMYFAIKHQYMFIKKVSNITLYSNVEAISNSEKKIKIFNNGLKKMSVKDIERISENWDLSNKKNSNYYMKYFIFIVLAVIIIILIFSFMNHKLKNLIKKKTKELEKLNYELEEKVNQRTKELEKKSIEAKRSAQTKARFLANMSHEIRTPLNSIIGFAEILKEEKLSQSAKKYAGIIEKSSKSLLGIINDILDFSKIEEGKLTIEKIPFNLDEEVENISQMFYQKANEKHISFKIEKDLKECDVITDPTRLKQVILNLLSNAFKFTDEDKTILLKVTYNNNKIFISVKDEGIGVAKDKIQYIFEEFSQADDSTTRKYGGTGLGLSISASLVRLLGGELKLKSKLGEGSEFFFTIPAKKSIKKEKQIIDKVNYEKFNYHILLVEDNKANQMFMGVILKKIGITFEIANDGVEAVEKYKQNYTKYDFILMDENMPNMTGRVATQEIRKYEKENKLNKVFIVALTAEALTGDKEKFIQAGMDEYLTKPLNIENLKTILKNDIISKKN